jgi:hypothetical protein
MISKILLVITLLTLSLLVYSNNVLNDTIFYNDHWEITSRTNAEFYRLAEFSRQSKCFIGEVRDYSINHKLNMIGFYKDGLRHGSFKFYSDNKTDSTIIQFENGKRVGNWLKYENGKLISQCIYRGDLEYVVKYTNPTNDVLIIDGNGKFKETRRFNSTDITLIIKGSIKDSLKQGSWQISDADSKKLWIDKYSDGKYKRTNLTYPYKFYDMSILSLDFSIFEIPNKLQSTESLSVERGVYIEANDLLYALKDNNIEIRGLQEHSNQLTGYKELEAFLDDNIIFNDEEIRDEDSRDTIVIGFIHNLDYSISNIEYIIPPDSKLLSFEILDILKSIDKIKLEEELSTPRHVSYIYRLKFPPDEMPVFIEKKRRK